jgi:hypothetical protein
MMIVIFAIGKRRALTPSESGSMRTPWRRAVRTGIGKTADALREDRSG